MSTPSTDLARLDKVSDLLKAKYGDLGAQAADQLALWLSGSIPLSNPDVIAALLRDDGVPLLFDSFWRLVPFGTGGRRGPVGYGPNRINPSVVAMTVQGHCDYLKQDGRTDLSVVVANDVRVFKDIGQTYRALGPSHPILGTSSRSLARMACEIYAGNGVRAYLQDASSTSDNAVMTTPMLSFAIRRLGAQGGVNMSASHNPPDDNGIKVYDEYGAQPIPPNDQRLADRMELVTSVARMAFDDAVREGLIRTVPDEVQSEYVRIYTELSGGKIISVPDVPITYTPLCGAGETTVGTMLAQLKFPVVMPPDQGPNGLFPVIPLRAPNPEVAQATRPAQVFADSHGSTIVLSSDPDADRLGLDVKLQDGKWYHCDGNQIATILTYLLMLDPEGPRKKGLVIETLVTTRLVREIAKKAGSRLIVDDLLVGFKYIADVLQSLAASGRYRDLVCKPEEIVVAVEESHGILMTPEIRDKDATGAAMYLAGLHQRLQRQGKTLLDYYASIIEEIGAFDCVNRSVMLKGAQGIEKRDRIMASLRASRPSSLAGSPVREVRDRWDTATYGEFLSETDRASRNLVEFECADFRVVVRPSGTEPKIKLYCELLASGAPLPERGAALLAAVRARAERIARTAYGDLLARVGASLGEAGLLLPDIVDLDYKVEFEQQTLPRFKEALTKGAFSNVEEALAWLRQALAQMTPGADPLPAVREAVGLAISTWDVGPAATVLRDLRDWASGRT